MAERDIYDRIIDAVAESVRRLKLADIPDGHVHTKRLITDRDIVLPAVVVAFFGPESTPGGTNKRDDVGYPVAVAVVKPGNQAMNYEEGDFGERGRIAKYFRQSRLSGVPEIYTCVWEPGPIVDLSLFRDHNLFVSSLTLRFLSREVRG